MLEFLILGSLYFKEATGYELKKHIESTFGVFYKASFGSLYPALKRLAQQEYVTAQDALQGARRKIVYRVTNTGKARFLDWLVTPMQVLDGTNPNLAKICFFDLLDEESRNKQLKQYERNNRHYLEKLEALARDFQAQKSMDAYYFKLSTLYYGIRVTRDTIEWCRHIREKRPLQEFIESGESKEEKHAEEIPQRGT